MTSPSKLSLGTTVVIGGCGFLGHHIVKELVESYDNQVVVVDLRTTHNRRPESDGVDYVDCDITDAAKLTAVFEKYKPSVVIHTASPHAEKTPDHILKKVNVDGTQCVVEACQNTGVTALVYTSSASVVSDNVSDLINADETYPIPTAIEYYTQTKAEAEKIVLASNRQGAFKLLTCAIRPAGIIGEGDAQMVKQMLAVYQMKKTNFQIGDNENLFDFTYVGNIADAHCLAAMALLTTAKSSIIPLDHERVDGEAFFITNDSPVYFWDMPRMVWRLGGNEQGTEGVWVMSRGVGLALGAVIEGVCGLLGKPAPLNRFRVRYSCMTRYYSIAKAKQRLGYRPRVSIQEGVTRAVNWALEDMKQADKKSQ